MMLRSVYLFLLGLAISAHASHAGGLKVRNWTAQVVACERHAHLTVNCEDWFLENKLHRTRIQLQLEDHPASEISTVLLPGNPSEQHTVLGDYQIIIRSDGLAVNGVEYSLEDLRNGCVVGRD